MKLFKIKPELTGLVEFFTAASLWDAFRHRAAKPWSEWSEAEIAESPMWCRYFLEDGGEPTDRIHTMMVMRSYEYPEDSHIKGYFRAWAERRSTTQG